MAASLFIRFNAGTCPHAIRLSLFKCKKTKAASQFCFASYNGSCHARTETLSRSFSSSPLRNQEAKVSEPLVTVDASQVTLPDGQAHYRESFIPMTRLSMIRHLVEDKNLLTEEEKAVFPVFARSLDRAVSNQYRGVLEELKNLFDPINPDKDTLQTREFSRREKLDNEFWLLQQLEDVMRKANFNELPKPIVESLLKEHTTNGVRVSVDWSRYDVLRFWVLGHEKPKVSTSLVEKVTNAVLRRPPRQASQYYKRVIVAIRLKRDSKLILKAFKEVPIQNLEMLLPDGTIKMSTMDKGVLVTSVSIAAFGILAKVVTYLASLHVDWTLLVTSITGLIGFRAWTMYKNRRNDYLIRVTRMLYYKNIANNRSLLAVLVDRAEDESFKEALLAYTFLVTSRPAAYRNKATSIVPASQLGGLTEEDLKQQVEDWVEKQTGARLHFGSTDAVALLTELGLLSRKDEMLSVLMPDVARRMLPAAPTSGPLGVRDDVMDGFDRTPFLETEEEYVLNDKKTSKYGWF